MRYLKAAVILLSSLFISFALAAQTRHPQYEISLRADPEAGRLNGEFVIRTQLTDKETKNLYLALLLNGAEEKNPYILPLFQESGPDGFSPSSIRLEDITVNGITCRWEYTSANKDVMIRYSQTRLFCKITLPEGLERENPIRIRFSYSARLSHTRGMDNFYFKDRLISRFDWFPYLLPEEFSLADPVVSLPMFTYAMDLTSRPGWRLVATGTDFTEQTAAQYRAESTLPVASLPLVVLKGFNSIQVPLKGGDKTVQVLYKPGTESIARAMASYARDILAYYQETYFPLDYRYISIVQDTPGAFGMASDGVVILGDGFFSGKDRVLPEFMDPTLDYLLAHELGHLYFGIGSPPDFLTENYLSEGLTEYASISYMEKKYGIWRNIFNEEKQDLLSDLFLFTYNYLGEPGIRAQKYRNLSYYHNMGWDFPLSQDSQKRVLNANYAVDYDKGYFVAQMLANYLGRERFNQALRQYLLDHRYSGVSSESLKRSLEKFYNRELGSFFEIFIYGNGDLDSALKGKLNSEKTATGYRSRFFISQRGELFIPLTLTLFLEPGVTMLVPVAGPGELLVSTPSRIQYAVLDQEFCTLDYNRRNNVYPPQITPVWTGRYWLKNGASLLFDLFPYLDSDAEGSYWGLGPRLYYPGDWTLFACPFFSTPAVAAGSPGPGYGGYFSWGKKIWPNQYLGVRSRVNQDAQVDFSLVDYSLTLFTNNSQGYVGIYYYPSFTLNTETGAMDLGLRDQTSPPYFKQLTQGSFDAIINSGTLLSLAHRFHYFYSLGEMENRLSLSWVQGVSVLPRILLGFKTAGSAAWGDLHYLGVGNQVLGFASTTANRDSYRISFKALVGFPLVNSLDISLFNWVVLQSLNGGLVYEAATAFSLWNQYSLNLKQAVGLEFYPFFRTTLDISFPLALGLSWNLSAILKDPGNPNRYYPVLYAETDLLPLLFANLSAY